MWEYFFGSYDFNLPTNPLASNLGGQVGGGWGFAHRALGVKGGEAGGGVPFFSRNIRRYLQGGEIFFAKAAHPSLEISFTHVALVLFLWRQVFDFFMRYSGQVHDLECVGFYFDAVGRTIPAFEQLLGKEGLEELIQ